MQTTRTSQCTPDMDGGNLDTYFDALSEHFDFDGELTDNDVLVTPYEATTGTVTVETPRLLAWSSLEWVAKHKADVQASYVSCPPA